MRLPTTVSQPMVQHLNGVYFNTVWNASDDHGRANFALPKIQARLAIGAVPLNLSVVGLPTTDTVYATYVVPYDVFGRFAIFPSQTWITDATLLAESVLITACTASGRMIASQNIFLRYDPIHNQVMIAIPYAVTTACAGASYPDLYMTVYKDTTRTTPIVTQTFMLSSAFGQSADTTALNQALGLARANTPLSTWVFVNGYYTDLAHLPSFGSGDVVHLITDPDIIGYCDISVDDATTGYQSDVYSGYREVLHIPKSLNPTNIVLTNDLMNVMVIDIASQRGVYDHRIDPHAIESITHNDVSMSRSNIQAFQTALDSQGVFVRLYIRMPTRPLTLTADVNHIADLYTFSDAEIVKQLTNQSSNQIPEWTAAYLETSPFLNLLYQFEGYQPTTALSAFSQAMGYYDVVSTLAQSMREYVYKGAQVEIFKPVRLYGIDCDALVYVNGRKVPASAAVISPYSSMSFLLGFSQSSHIPVGAVINVYIIESGFRQAVPFSPTAQAPSIVVDNDDYAVMAVVPYTTPQPVWNKTVTVGYRTVALSPADYQVANNSDGTTTYTFKTKNLGQSFLLMPQYGVTHSVYPIDALLTDKAPIVLDITTVTSTGTTIPVMAYNCLEVYLNGYRLTEGLDYQCDPIAGPDANVLQTLLTVSNQSYLQLGVTGNAIEVVVHGDQAVSEDKGYVIANMMQRVMPPMFWSQACGRVFANGVLINDVTETGAKLMTENIPDGAPYYLQWSLPYSVAKLMQALSPNPDISLKTRIDRVLKLTDFVYPATVVLTALYAIYSPFLAQVAHDVADGVFTIVNDPKDDTFLKQFGAYQLLYTHDPVVGASNPVINRKFVTLAAHYTNLAAPDPVQMMLLQRLINLVLTPSDLSLLEVLI